MIQNSCAETAGSADVSLKPYVSLDKKMEAKLSIKSFLG